MKLESKAIQEDTFLINREVRLASRVNSLPRGIGVVVDNDNNGPQRYRAVAQPINQMNATGAGAISIRATVSSLKVESKIHVLHCGATHQQNEHDWTRRHQHSGRSVQLESRVKIHVLCDVQVKSSS
jgi:hypothetical protein